MSFFLYIKKKYKNKIKSIIQLLRSFYRHYDNTEIHIISFYLKTHYKYIKYYMILFYLKIPYKYIKYCSEEIILKKKYRAL